MVVSRRSRLESEIALLVLLLLGYQGLAFQPILLNHHHHVQKYATRRINSANSETLFGFSTTRHKKEVTQLALTGSDELATAANSCLWISFNDGPGLGGLVLGLGFVASIAAFVFANLVYTPEILEGAEELRRDEREEQISKILQAVQVHALEGKDVGDLRLALETALGKSLEDYVQGVLENENDNDSLVTAADQELATILKQTLVQ